MDKELKFAIFIGVAALVAWFVASRSQPAVANPARLPGRKWRRDWKGSGDHWMKPVVQAPAAGDDVTPEAQIQ